MLILGNLKDMKLCDSIILFVLIVILFMQFC